MVLLKKKYNKVVGIDLGNGLIKIKATGKESDEVISYRLPSAYALAENLGVSFNGETNLQLDTFEFNDEIFLWGKDVIQLDGIESAHGHEGRYSTLAYRNMVAMVIGKIFKDAGITDEDNVLIVTGVPSIETGTTAEKDIKKAFTNDGEAFDIKINGEHSIIKIMEEDIIVISQPVATVVGRYLNEDGTVRDKDYESMKVVVVDIGGGTTDFDLIKRMQRQPKDCDSLNEGFRDVYDFIRKDIRKSYENAQPTDFDLLNCILVGGATGKFTYRPNKRVEPHDFTDAIHKAIERLATSIQGKITSIWKNQSDIDEVLLVGGSAHFFEEDVDSVISGVTVPANNGDSNVDGYFKYGVYANNKVKKEVYQ